MIERKITLYIKEEKPKRKKFKKKKLEFMQKIVLISFLFSFTWVTLSYILAWNEKPNPLENLSGIVVSALIASILGYVTQNSARSVSYNKMQSEIVKVETTQEKPQEDTMMKERENRGT